MIEVMTIINAFHFEEHNIIKKITSCKIQRPFFNCFFNRNVIQKNSTLSKTPLRLYNFNMINVQPVCMDSDQRADTGYQVINKDCMANTVSHNKK